MEDIPQPAREPYEPGNHVTVYLSADDPDAEYSDHDCRVIEVLTDDLNRETKRATDAYSYRVEDVETEEELPVVFRHRDLVPTNE